MDIRQRYELVRLDGETDTLKRHPRNPRIGNTKAIDESIGANGWYGAVTVQRSTGYILAGNHRYDAAVNRGASEIPVVWVDVDDETALRILLADNKIADLGEYDEETLTDVLASLDTLEGTGYGLEQVEDLEEGRAEPEEDAVPDDRYTPSYGVMVICSDEDDQERTFDWLTEHVEPERLKVVAV